MLLQGLLLNDPYQRPVPGWLVVADGRIVEVGHGEPPGQPDAGGPDCLICPGFVDAHLHLPQIDSIGCDGLDLLQWLDRVIYQVEMRWADEAFAARQIESAYQRMLRAGTLGYAGYLTSHFHGYVHVVRAGQHIPLRALVGQVLMDRNAPAELLGHRPARIASSQRSRVWASVNPRFAITCSDASLNAAASRVLDNTFIQTHLAESEIECKRVRALFASDPHYSGIYDRHGLLTQRTLLAHCVHLNQEEWALIAKRNSVAVHCPGANVFLRAGSFDLDAARKHGVRLALGSDVAAGPDLAMPRVARAMIETAKMRAMTIAGSAYVPSPADVWSIITRGNAEALGWSDWGRLEVGAGADLLILKPPFECDEHLIGRLIYTWSDDYIVHRVVAGRLF